MGARVISSVISHVNSSHPTSVKTGLEKSPPPLRGGLFKFHVFKSRPDPAQSHGSGEGRVTITPTPRDQPAERAWSREAMKPEPAAK